MSDIKMLTAIQEILSDMGVDFDEINAETHLENELGIDSTEMVELVLNLERKFNTRFEKNKINTVGNIINSIKN